MACRELTILTAEREEYNVLITLRVMEDSSRIVNPLLPLRQQHESFKCP
jgi:hypothetical protein